MKWTTRERVKGDRFKGTTAGGSETAGRRSEYSFDGFL
jgi:hypothetical protein